MQQTTLPIKPQQSYNLDDFIVSECNSEAYDVLLGQGLTWGVLPYNHALLLTGPRSCGKSYLARLWHNSFDKILVEDIDQKIDQEELLHIFNSAHEQKKPLLMTASILPDFALKDLHSRIHSINRVAIKRPDDQIISMLLFKLFSNHSIVITPEISKFLISKLDRDFAGIIDKVDHINEYALSKKRRITIPLIKEAL